VKLFRVQGSGFRVQGSGFRVQGSGFRIQGSGFRLQGLGMIPAPVWTPQRQERRNIRVYLGFIQGLLRVYLVVRG
jgi:hypothetical protein